MKTRLLLVAAAVLLGGAYVAAQVETPADSEAARSAEEVPVSTSTAKPDEDMEGGAFEDSTSTSTYDRSGLEDRVRERGAVEDDAGTGAETDSGSDSETDSDADETRPQRP